MLAMADILRQNDKSTEVIFIGRCGGKENEAIRRAGYEPYEIEVEGLKRSLSPRNVRAVLRAIRARRTARSLLRELSPDAVIGTGGYVCWPVLSAAHSLGIKCAIHESNAYPGLVTRRCSRWVDLVMLGYSEAEKHLRHSCKSYVTGNPVRNQVGRISRSRARAALKIPSGKTVVLSFGGSLGAKAINDSVTEMIEKDGGRSGILYIHATGEKWYNEYREKEREWSRILPYINDMPVYLAAADIGILRCGAMTLAEVEAAGLPSILIPSPNVTANHQFKNARALADDGCAVVIRENDLNSEALKSEILHLVRDNPLRHGIREKLQQRHKGTDTRIFAAISTLVTDK